MATSSKVTPYHNENNSSYDQFLFQKSKNILLPQYTSLADYPFHLISEETLNPMPLMSTQLTDIVPLHRNMGI